MSDENPPSILGSLPSSRPHRRSDKREPRTTTPSPKPAAKVATKTKSATKPKPATRPKPAAEPKPATKAEPTVTPVASTPSIELTHVLGVAVKAGAELAEIGLSAGARALKLVVSRLPRP